MELNRQARRELRKGKTEPRFFTPPLRPLTPETSLGFEVVRFAELLGIELYPWQKWVLIHGLELLPDGRLRFKVVIIEVARQNGKTMLMIVLALWRLYQYGASEILSTAQSLGDAEATLEKAFLIAAWNPVLRWFLPDNARAEEDDDHYNGAYRPRGNAKTAMKLRVAPVPEVLDVAGQLPIWSLGVTSRKGGRSKSVDLALLDELRELLEWDPWNAIVPTTRNRPRSQVWGFSNAGDHRSIVLSSQRKSALSQIEDGTTKTTQTAFFSWSAHPEANVLDAEAHAQANPTMGYSAELTAESLMAEAEAAVRADNERGWAAEALCQWPVTTTPGKIPMRLWSTLRDPESHRAPGAEVHVAVDVSHEGRYSHVAICSTREDGLWHVEVIASRAGYRWVPGWLQQRKDNGWFDGVVGMQVKGSPSAALAPLLREAGMEVLEWQGTDMSSSVLGFVDEIRARGVRHRGQPVLDVSIEGAVDRQRGEISIWDRVNSATDASPTVATNIAWWVATRIEEDEFKSAYGEDYELDEEQLDDAETKNNDHDDYDFLIV